MTVKPTGSGYFAAFCGMLFALVFLASFFVHLSQLQPRWIMRGWILFVAVVLIYWGRNRIRTGKQDPTVGQETINLIIAVAAATVALLGLFLKK